MNILVLTKIYPADDLSKAETPIVHYFAKEWVKMGHNVIVVVNYPVFPKIVDSVIGKFEGFITSFTGDVPPRRCNAKFYQMEDVNVYRYPMEKVIPHRAYSKSDIIKQKDVIVDTLSKLAFVPDLAVGHWWNPQVPLLSLIKEKYNCKTAVVLHSDIKATGCYKEYFSGIDCWGFRSRSLLKEYIKIFGTPQKAFICYSGIPEEMVDEKQLSRSFDGKLKHFLFCGQLIKRKYPAEIVEAVANNYTSDEQFDITYIGAGKEYQKIEKTAEKKGMKEHVIMCGRIPRDKVKAKMNHAECFIMMSKNEAYGLVYLEAMSAGCLVVASKNEGFDGIIEHGVNGFLCNAGDVNDLSRVITEINSLPENKKVEISKNAIKTVENLTDSKVAKRYLIDIL